MAFFGRKSPLEALVMPGVILACKYNQFRQRRREAQSKKVTERELTALHHKIEKLLSKLEESDLEPSSAQEDECVICITSRATMKTMPCGHQVVCRRCFVKTIQSAVAQRLLPLRCVICRTRINRLTSSSGSWRLQESASSYSVGAKSWNVPGSASSYSVGAHSYTMGERVAQSASLYSMSSGSSCASGFSSGSGSSTSRASSASVSSSSSNAVDNKHHQHHSSCSTNNCSGAIPRNPSYTSSSFSYHRGHKSHSFRNRIPDMPNRLPPIKEYTVRSPSRHRTPSPVNSGVRFKSYTASSKAINLTEMVPLLDEPSISPSPIPSTSSTKKLTKNSSKVAPIISNATLINKSSTQAATIKPSTSGFKPYTVSSAPSSSKSAISDAKQATLNSSKDDKKDNKKSIENHEKKKREEKIKQKAEKEAKKEEKRLAKEEEKLIKMRAKEEKKRGKTEAKTALLVASS